MNLSLYVPALLVLALKWLALFAAGLALVAICSILAWFLYRQSVSWPLMVKAINFYRQSEEARRTGLLARPDGWEDEKKELIERHEARVEWYISEHSRLSRKCEAICNQLRKFKGRGLSLVESRPMRNF